MFLFEWREVSTVYCLEKNVEKKNHILVRELTYFVAALDWEFDA